MTTKNYIDIAKDVLTAVETDLIDVDGAFKKQPDFKDDLTVLQAVEAAYVAHGGVINPNVQKVIAGVVAILTISGVL